MQTYFANAKSPNKQDTHPIVIAKIKKALSSRGIKAEAQEKMLQRPKTQAQVKLSVRSVRKKVLQELESQARQHQLKATAHDKNCPRDAYFYKPLKPFEARDKAYLLGFCWLGCL